MDFSGAGAFFEAGTGADTGADSAKISPFSSLDDLFFFVNGF